ncbi:uncharacterized protein LOC121193792 [Toxotes jaculatrix]|uniref:uncharacterized protein LOC121193792 n=1 Tax=Toxotes jaculatrix TaxID=941984 RepID=UPI001B3B006C|nr:uncharacterized protein LOC121193792 [Toxotes jaculatrix]
MLSLLYCGMFPLVLIILKGVSCEQLTPVKDEEFSSEGSSVTLSYTYSKKAAAGDYFFWYRQHPGKPPQFLISHLASGQLSSDPVSGLNVTVSRDQTQMDLQISSAAVTDSAVYYCAVKPTVTGNSTTLYKNLWSKDNRILHNILQHFTSVNMEKLAALLFFSALVGNSLEDDITASRAEVFSSEGRTVTLSCKYSVKAENLQWYRQDPESGPQYLLLITDTKEPDVVKAKPPHPGLTAELNEERNRVDLQISSAAVTDSAVYYCAVRPTVTGNSTTLYKNLWSKDNRILHNIH